MEFEPRISKNIRRACLVDLVLEGRKEMHCELLLHFMKKSIKKLHQILIVLAQERSTRRNLLKKVFFYMNIHSNAMVTVIV